MSACVHGASFLSERFNLEGVLHHGEHPPSVWLHPICNSHADVVVPPQRDVFLQCSLEAAAELEAHHVAYILPCFPHVWNEHWAAQDV